MNHWIYETNCYNTARYVLGEKGPNPLICIGVNPSTATPCHLDNTLRNVRNWSVRLNYEGWIMLNLYPQRATDPNGLHDTCDSFLHRTNLKWINRYIGSSYIHGFTIWAAWGTLIEKRSYLKDCLLAIATANKNFEHRWITIGQRSKDGHPHHPLYLSKKATPEDFDIIKYLKRI